MTAKFELTATESFVLHNRIWYCECRTCNAFRVAHEMSLRPPIYS